VSDESRAGAVLYAKDMNRVAAFYETVLRLRPWIATNNMSCLEFFGIELVVLRISRRDCLHDRDRCSSCSSFRGGRQAGLLRVRISSVRAACRVVAVAS